MVHLPIQRSPFPNGRGHRIGDSPRSPLPERREGTGTRRDRLRGAGEAAGGSGESELCIPGAAQPAGASSGRDAPAIRGGDCHRRVYLPAETIAQQAAPAAPVPFPTLVETLSARHPESTGIAVTNQTSPQLSHKPHTLQLIDTRLHFALFRLLYAFKMYFKVARVF